VDDGEGDNGNEGDDDDDDNDDCGGEDIPSFSTKSFNATNSAKLSSDESRSNDILKKIHFNTLKSQICSDNGSQYFSLNCYHNGSVCHQLFILFVAEVKGYFRYQND
jgi:hypothetical protein